MSRVFTAAAWGTMASASVAAVVAWIGFRPGALWIHVPPPWLVMLTRTGLPTIAVCLLALGIAAIRRRAGVIAAATFALFAVVAVELCYFAWQVAHA